MRPTPVHAHTSMRETRGGISCRGGFLPAGRNHEACCLAVRGSGRRDGCACAGKDVRVLSHIPFVYVARPISPAACHHRRRRRSAVAIGLLLLQGHGRADRKGGKVSGHARTHKTERGKEEHTHTQTRARASRVAPRTLQPKISRTCCCPYCIAYTPAAGARAVVAPFMPWRGKGGCCCLLLPSGAP